MAGHDAPRGLAYRSDKRRDGRNGRAALRLFGGRSDVPVIGNVRYEGVRDDGTGNLTTYGNGTPSR